MLLAEVHRLHEEVAKREKMLTTYNMSWEEKLANTEAHAVECDTELSERRKALALPGDEVEHGVSCLVNLNQDPLFSECLVYYIREGETTIGSDDSSDVVLSGGDMHHKHAEIWCAGAEGWGEGSEDGSGGGGENGKTVALLAKDDAMIFVNGIEVGPASASVEGGEDGTDADSCRCVELCHGDRVVFGRSHFFRFEARASGGDGQQESVGAAGEIGAGGANRQTHGENTSGGNVSVSQYDWGFAHRELQQQLAERDRSEEEQQAEQQRLLAQRAQARMETMQDELEKQRLRSERQHAKQKMSSARKAKRQRAQAAGLQQAEAEISDLRQQLDLQLEKVSESGEDKSDGCAGDGEIAQLRRQLAERDHTLAASETERRRLLAVVEQVEQDEQESVSSLEGKDALAKKNMVLLQEKKALLKKVEEQREAMATMRRAQAAHTEIAAKAKKSQSDAAQAKRQLKLQLKEQAEAHGEVVDGLRSCYEQMITDARAQTETAVAAAAAAEEQLEQARELASGDTSRGNPGMSVSTSSSMAKLENLADQMRLMRQASERPATRSAIDFGQHAEALETAASSALALELQLAEAREHIQRQEVWEAKALARDKQLQQKIEELMQVQVHRPTRSTSCPPIAPSMHDQEERQKQKRLVGEGLVGKRAPLVDTQHHNSNTNVLGAARTWPVSS
jgi:hypothetical protein